MLFDTDILIWVQRGNEKAAHLIDKTPDRFISMQTYMELFQSAKNKEQHRFVKNFLSEAGFITLPLTENIGHRASIYIEEYTLKDGIQVGDAIIAATAVENNLPLVSGNQKHFKSIKDLNFKVFRP